MSTERFIETNDIEKKLSERELRLPKGIRKYIRTLKEQGKLKEAMKVRREELEKKKSAREKLQDVLNLEIAESILSDNDKIQALSKFRATWILSQTGEIDPRERIADIENIYREHPEQDLELQEKGQKIIAEVAELVKKANV